MSKKDVDKCQKCEGCRHCEILQIGHELEGAVYRFLEIHNTKSDVIFCHQLMLNECRKDCELFDRFRMLVKKLGIDF